MHTSTREKRERERGQKHNLAHFGPIT
uniref:Uncharacterized protein n=1 Tax=Rhizophora mucronata TaxID=61149 RepID=A0A2P2QC99_RHIMU